MKQDVIIVGAGLAGLAAAVHLHRQGRKVLLLEASERAGGRIKTDSHEGFLLDRGFQVLLTAYPETQALLNKFSLPEPPKTIDLCDMILNLKEKEMQFIYQIVPKLYAKK